MIKGILIGLAVALALVPGVLLMLVCLGVSRMEGEEDEDA